MPVVKKVCKACRTKISVDTESKTTTCKHCKTDLHISHVLTGHSTKSDKTHGVRLSVIPKQVDTELIRELHSEGKSDGKIAVIMGLSDVTIGKYRNRMGLPVNLGKSGKYNYGWTKPVRSHSIRHGVR
jgi:biotin synthase-related radical SAM superfamily protein